MGFQMNYTEKDLKIVEGTNDIIRQHPEMFLGRINPSDGVGLSLGMVWEILSQEGRQAFCVRFGDWCIVASDVDWLAATINSSLGEKWGLSISDLFYRHVPFVEGEGPNSMHCEVIINTFAKDVVTFDEKSHVIVKGELNESLLKFRDEHSEWKRVVAFRMK